MNGSSAMGLKCFVVCVTLMGGGGSGLLFVLSLHLSFSSGGVSN